MTPRRLRPYLAVGALVVVGAVAVVALAPAPAPDNSNPSSWATGTQGSWALYQLAQALRARPARLTGSGFSAGLRSPGPGGSGATLVEYQPTVRFSGSAARAISAFVRAGGRLVLAGGSAAVDARVLSQLGLTTLGHLPARTLRERLPLGGRAPLLVRVGSGPSYAASTPAARPLLGSPAAPAAEVVTLGRGEAIVLGSAAPLSNQGLRQAQDALFAVRALRVSPGRPVLFDEIHHGYQLGDGVSALLWGTTLGASGLVLAALVLLFLASRGRRLGRPLPAPHLRAARGTADHLEAVAQLYARTGDRRAVAERYRAELAAELAASPAHPTDPGGGPGPERALLEALERAAREGVDGPTLVDLAEKARGVGLELMGAVPRAGR